MRSPSNILILNLSIADFMVSLATLPAVGIGSLAQEWVFGGTGNQNSLLTYIFEPQIIHVYFCCMVYGFLGAGTSIVSIMTLTLIGIERCAVIAFSRKMTQRKLVALIIFTWLYGIFWAIMPLVGWGRYIIEGSQTSCTFDFLSQDKSTKSFVVSLQVCVFHIPVCLLFFSYISIFVKVRRHEQMMDRLKKEHFLRSKRLDRETRVAKSALIITLVFCLAWLPYAVISIIGCYGNAMLVTPMTSALPGFCAKLSTSINPILYALCHEKYRNKIGHDIRSVIRCTLSTVKIPKL
ncbi:rhodopsin-like [Pecten maximus]|uniref:rhodopsin-like n=1 Tax=Pecten maximus TaxID=6579 RepID=UPI0014586D82|nr:rhodopsin-like [Pecten maximus]